ncbi:DNA-directed RNA polymerase III, subunit Rpc31 [Phaeosphaeria sp. MPI-PUGE-AT-0046c]|nr:DNA-directed RNA polymerase III, subunit Rpc31 [Phaeosphaeria sp. MPI-PUGE-AT-0046c]
MPPGGRGGRGGGRGGASFNGKVTIAGTELNWDLTGLDIQKGPAERFPEAPPPQAPPPTAHENGIVAHYLAVRDRIHEGPFYTILNDGMKNGLKRKANEPAPTEASLFNPFTDNQTYSAKYLKVRRRLPKLDARPYVTDLFPTELRPILTTSPNPSHASHKKRRTLGVSKINAVSQIERMIKAEQDRSAAGADDEAADDDDDEAEPGDDEDKEGADDDAEDDFSAASSDSEESDDDYNAEQYFDNGEDEDIDDADPYENTYE